jgi:hypothetical protein
MIKGLHHNAYRCRDSEVRSIYFRDPNGYVVELTASTGRHGEMMDPVISRPHEALARWQAEKSH